MNNRLYILLRGAIFSGLGLFSFLLLATYTNLLQEISGSRPTVVLLFFVALFNLLGYLTIRMSTWLNNQYTLHIRHRWKIAVAYGVVIISTLGINYALLVTAKLLTGSEHPFTFPNGGLRILILVWLIELVILGLMSANKSMLDTLKLQQKTAALQEENNTARYIALQNQLNPHFLFNSLNTLVSEIEYDPPRAAVFTRNLSSVYRYVLQCQNKPLVHLRDELTFAAAYFYLHEVRLGECIRNQIHVPEKYNEAMLPPLTLQLLIENVIKHNSITTMHPMLVLVNIDNGWLVVKNTLTPRRGSDSTGVGLQNLSNRCQMMFGKGIEIVKTPGQFIVKVPLLYE